MVQPIEALPTVMREYADGMEEAVGILMKRAALKIAEVAAESTRADTGLARSNWVVRIGGPFTGVIAPYAPGEKLGFGESANLGGALSQHKSALSGYVAKKQASIYITNNVRYIGYLNYGSPTTSADMMLEKAQQAGRAIISNARILKKKV